MKLIWCLVVILIILVLSKIPAKMIYHPSRYPSPLILESNVQCIPYDTDQGTQMAYYIKSRSPREESHVWLLFSGNAALALQSMPLIRTVADAFLLFDYPGYGECKGTCSPKAIQKSAKKACAALEAQIGKRQWNVIGHSLGAAAAFAFAAECPVDIVIAIAPFTTMLEMARLFVGPLCYFPHRHHFDNQQRLREIRKKAEIPDVYIMHGTADQVVPISMSRQLYDEFYDIIKYHEVPNADHTNILKYVTDTVPVWL